MDYCPFPLTNHDWVVVNTQPHRERFAADNLERQGYTVYCPHIVKRIRHARRAYDARRPMFPSYLFVEYASLAYRWRPILSTYGVRTIIRNGETPSLLDGDFIDILKARELEGVVRKPENPFHVGQKVAVQGGSLDGLIGEIIEMREKDRVLVLLNWLNQRVKTHLHADMLSRA